MTEPGSTDSDRSGDLLAAVNGMTSKEKKSDEPRTPEAIRSLLGQTTMMS